MKLKSSLFKVWNKIFVDCFYNYYEEKIKKRNNFLLIAVGVDGLFLETHFDPSNAKSDGANMLDLKYLENLLTRLVAIRKTINSFK